MTKKLDPRLNAFRADLADVRLRGAVKAVRFVAGRRAVVSAPVAAVRRRPAADAPLDTEALHGEEVAVFETDENGWSWCQLCEDGYVGYVERAALRFAGTEYGEGPLPVATHRVRVPRTFRFPQPDIKGRPLDALPMGAVVQVTGRDGDHNADYAGVLPEGWIVEQHLEPASASAPDFVAVAEAFLGVPYLWGGKSALGIDCSGLVQLAAEMAGIAAPRDTDMQERALGTRIAGVEALARGDLVFWKGHVGIMLDGARLLHANAHHMMTAIEPLGTTIERLEAKGVCVTGVRRLVRPA